MEYLEFSRQQVTDLQNSLQREFLRTNKAGSYANSTIVNCNTRKYHGLLVCPIKEIDGENYVLLSSLDETVILENTPFQLATHKFGNEIYPTGYKYLESYKNSPVLTLVYRVGGLVLQKEMVLVDNDERFLIRYTVLSSTLPQATLQLRPFLAFRKVHELTHANTGANTRHLVIENGISNCLYEYFPTLNMQLSKKNEFVSAPDWYRNFTYDRESERGFECAEDLFTPGFFEVSLKEGDSVVFSAGLKPIKTTTLKGMFEKETKGRDVQSNFEECLRHAARQFMYRSPKGCEVIASFPWTGLWGRDSLVSLPGLTLAQGDWDTCRAVLDTMSNDIDGYVYKNKGNIEHTNTESIDTALWYIRSVQQFNWNTKDVALTRKLYQKKVEEILNTYMSGENGNVIMHDNGLLYLPDENKALTWVDAKINGVPVVKRWGYVVEVNALWYNAICFALELITKKSFQDKWKDVPAKIEKSFTEMFWDEEKGYLADFCVGDYKDFSMRPSQIFGASLPFAPLSDEKRHSVLEHVRKELLTPCGIRTLSPKSQDYIGTITGSIEQRDKAYHNGGVLMWLLAPYAEAYLKLHGRSGVAEIKRIYADLESLVTEYGLGTIGEVFDGNPPYTARGSISQAWSVGAALRICKLIENFEAEKQK
ncbi:MAG: amylo-alpha-1,6-glucosidase [Bacteroidales bacterium]|nr:amylo-alpha-1,6-glucosidase [Bacteroidales bacterium]